MKLQVEMQERFIEVTRTARYYQMGNIGESTRKIWFVCHGYGQLARYFLKHFDVLANDQTCIIAPEGLSRFYLNGFYGKIGSSWMTREDRLHEIKDYVIYLDAVYKQVFEQVDRASVNVSILGFSQGTAAVSRWVTLGDVKTDRLILWAGLLPTEIIQEKKLEIFHQVKLLLVMGEDDEYGSSDKIIEQETQLRDQKIPYQLIKFKGGHEMDIETLKHIGNLPLLNDRSDAK